MKNKNNRHRDGMQTRNTLARMIEIYEIEDVDWMGFKLTKDNPYTYHHIKERRNGGLVTLDNGAVLTRKGHDFLNFLDLKDKKAYDDYQAIFREINKAKGKISDDLWEDIYGMMLDLFYYKTYSVCKRYDLSKFENYTYCKMLIK